MFSEKLYFYFNNVDYIDLSVPLFYLTTDLTFDETPFDLEVGVQQSGMKFYIMMTSTLMSVPKCLKAWNNNVWVPCFFCQEKTP